MLYYLFSVLLQRFLFVCQGARQGVAKFNRALMTGFRVKSQRIENQHLCRLRFVAKARGKCLFARVIYSSSLLKVNRFLE